MSRQVILFVATSLDGHIADEEGGVDWLFSDQDYGFGNFYKSIDTVLVGRKTYEVGLKLGQTHFQGKRNVVFSRTLRASSELPVEITDVDPVQFVEKLMRQPGLDVWLVGGGELFGCLLQAGLVHRVSVAVHPIILGRGISLFNSVDRTYKLSLYNLEQFETGLVTMHYTVEPSLE